LKANGRFPSSFDILASQPQNENLFLTSFKSQPQHFPVCTWYGTHTLQKQPWSACSAHSLGQGNRYSCESAGKYAFICIEKETLYTAECSGSRSCRTTAPRYLHIKPMQINMCTCTWMHKGFCVLFVHFDLPMHLICQLALFLFSYH
jgi:hypothetical protein